MKISKMCRTVLLIFLVSFFQPCSLQAINAVTKLKGALVGSTLFLVWKNRDFLTALFNRDERAVKFVTENRRIILGSAFMGGCVIAAVMCYKHYKKRALIKRTDGGH